MIKMLVMVMLVLSSALQADDNTEIPYMKFTVNDRTTFIPSQFTSLIDSVKVNPDYIDQMMINQFTDTINTESLYNDTDPQFDTYEMGDSAVVMSRKNMALFIRDASLLQYKLSEIDARKKLQTQFINSAIVAESLYRQTLLDANIYTGKIYNQYKTELKSKEKWRITFFILSAFAGGYIVNELVGK